jgi:hypothetical protein
VLNSLLKKVAMTLLDAMVKTFSFFKKNKTSFLDE